MLRAGKEPAKLGQPSLPTGEENNRFISRCRRFISFHMLPNGSQRDSSFASSPFLIFWGPQAASLTKERASQEPGREFHRRRKPPACRSFFCLPTDVPPSIQIT